MRSALVIAVAWLTMACAAAPDGTLKASLGLADLTADERAMVEERFGAEFAEARANGLPAGAPLAFARCDLNDVAPAEVIAMGRGPQLCGTGAGAADCGLWTLAFVPDGWVEILETTGRARLADSVSNGWRDIVVERGGAPETFKFDGGSYVSQTGGMELAPDTASSWGLGMDGQGLAARSEILWLTIEDDLPAEAESVFLWFYVNRALEGDGAMRALPADFRIGLTDLDGAGTMEVAVRAETPAFCTADGCRLWIYRPGEGDAPPEEIAQLRGFDLQVAASGAEGLRDLIVSGRDGLEVWRREGGVYALRMPGGAGVAARRP